MTREHVWPDWVRRLAGEIDEPFPHDQEIEVDGEPSEIREWKMPPFSMTAKAFCAECNNGWMSQLEGQAKELVERWLNRGAGSWHRRQQRELASWALLRAIVFDQTHPPTAVVPRSFIDHLRDKGKPPPGCWVTLTLANPEAVGLYSFQGLHVSPAGAPEAPPEPTVFIVTFTIGQLVFQLYGSLLDDLDYFGRIEFPQLEVVRIWPYERGTVDFSPRQMMSARNLEMFAVRVFEDLQNRLPGEGRVTPVSGLTEKPAPEASVEE